MHSFWSKVGVKMSLEKSVFSNATKFHSIILLLNNRFVRYGVILRVVKPSLYSYSLKNWDVVVKGWLRGSPWWQNILLLQRFFNFCSSPLE